MDRPEKRTRLTPEEQELKERQMRSGNPVVREGSIVTSAVFRKLSKTREGRRALVRRLASSGRPEDIWRGRPISNEFWKLPMPEDPEGLALRYLLEDRRQGR